VHLLVISVFVSYFIFYLHVVLFPNAYLYLSMPLNTKECPIFHKKDGTSQVREPKAKANEHCRVSGSITVQPVWEL
jgi:hypothetical protein